MESTYNVNSMYWCTGIYDMLIRPLLILWENSPMGSVEVMLLAVNVKCCSLPMPLSKLNYYPMVSFGFEQDLQEQLISLGLSKAI